VGVSTGIPSLDAMFDIGGYAQGSVTALTGPSGSGKTTLALHFAAAAGPQEKALFFGFYEPPELLLRIGDMLGIPLRGQADAGRLHFLAPRFGENLLDGLAAQLLAEVRRTGATRVVIDGIGGLAAAPAFPERGGPFVARFLDELRRLGATTLVTLEEGDATRARVVDTPTLSATADTLVEMMVRREGAVRRYAAIRKTRVSRCDLRVRELVLTEAGVEVGDPLRVEGA
jgi:circadian clock protein KaiC